METIHYSMNKFHFWLIFLIISIIFPIQANAQHWSEPVILSNGGYNTENSFAIDKDGIIHCVWSHMLQDNFYQIYYTKSVDNGATWTHPAQMSSNNHYWLGNPHIVADSNKNLFVS